MVELLPHQREVLNRLSNGKILWGGVGSGKSIVSLAYYMEKEMMNDLYVITTAKKRDSLEWQGDAAKFGIGLTKDTTVAGVLHIDSWNNIDKYTDVTDSFFIFDEQRLVGNGAWVKSFQKIVKNGNAWIILSATPGDTWLDYIPVFIANGYYKNVTQFKREHIVYAPFSRFPKIDRYLGTAKLEKLKNEVLVEMEYLSSATRHLQEVRVFYDVDLFNKAWKDRWNVFEDRPIREAGELFAVCRRIVYGDESRIHSLRGLMEKHPKLIVFYNFNYELEMLRELNDTWSDLVGVGEFGSEDSKWPVFAEWNGTRKQEIPKTDNWVYLVQYTAGAEGWNCTETDAMVFFSLTYSYKKFEQSQGRIDRLTSKFTDLYYYMLVSESPVDRAVRASLNVKQTFNERKWADENLPTFAQEIV